MPKNSDTYMVLGVLVIAALAFVFIGKFQFSIVGSGCQDISDYVNILDNGNTLQFATPAWQACNSNPSVTCYSLPIDFNTKVLQSVSVSESGSLWYSRWDSNGNDLGELYRQNAIQNPTFKGGAPFVYPGVGGWQMESDGLIFNIVGTDQQRNWKWCCAGVCAGSSYSISGTINLTDKPSPNPGPTPEPNPDPAGDNGKIIIIVLLGICAVAGLMAIRKLKK